MKYLELNNKIKKSLVKMKIIKSKLNNYNNNQKNNQIFLKFLLMRIQMI